MILPVVAVLVAAGIVLAFIQVRAPGSAGRHGLRPGFAGQAGVAGLSVHAGGRQSLATHRPAKAGRWRHDATAGALDRGIEVLIVLADLRRCRLLALHAAATRAGDRRRTAGIGPYPHAEGDGRRQRSRPATPGRLRVSIFIMTGDFGPLDAKEVTLVLSQAQVRHRADQTPGDQARRRHLARRRARHAGRRPMDGAARHPRLGLRDGEDRGEIDIRP